MISSAAAARSARGIREENQDACWVGDDLVIVADGLGGHGGGREAARLAVGAALCRLANPVPAAVTTAFEAADDAVLAHRARHPDAADAGTTLTIVVVDRGDPDGVSAVIGHVGDSPAWLVRDGNLELLTPPHNVAELLVQAGEITPEEAHQHPARHELLRAVGSDGIPDLTSVALRPSDRILVCTDGLLDVPDVGELTRIATADETPHVIIDRLVDHALETSSDNVTAAMLTVRGHETAVRADADPSLPVTKDRSLE